MDFKLFGSILLFSIALLTVIFSLTFASRKDCICIESCC